MLLLTDYLDSWFTLQSLGLDFHWSLAPEQPGTFIFMGSSVPSYTAPFQTCLCSEEVTSSGLGEAAPASTPFPADGSAYRASITLRLECRLLTSFPFINTVEWGLGT